MFVMNNDCRISHKDISIHTHNYTYNLFLFNQEMGIHTELSDFYVTSLVDVNQVK